MMGSKNLKAIAVEGTKGVNIADRKEMKRLNDYMMTELIGANNNHVVPSTPQAWGGIFLARVTLDCTQRVVLGRGGRWADRDRRDPRRVIRTPSASGPTNRSSI